MANTSNLPLEALEVEYPPTMLRYELVERFGRHRPVPRRHGVASGVRAEAECHLRLDGSRLLTPPRGLGGGHPGGHGAFRFGDGFEPFVNGSDILRAGQTVEMVTPGAAAMALVPSAFLAIERDLADQGIDPATAAAMYPEFRR
jgi:N-methylhydantoinase B